MTGLISENNVPCYSTKELPRQYANFWPKLINLSFYLVCFNNFSFDNSLNEGKIICANSKIKFIIIIIYNTYLSGIALNLIVEFCNFSKKSSRNRYWCWTQFWNWKNPSKNNSISILIHWIFWCYSMQNFSSPILN